MPKRNPFDDEEPTDPDLGATAPCDECKETGVVTMTSGMSYPCPVCKGRKRISKRESTQRMLRRPPPK